MSNYGVRIYSVSKDTILIKQTVKKPTSERYVVDRLLDGTHRERHVKINDDVDIADAVRQAIMGCL